MLTPDEVAAVETYRGRVMKDLYSLTFHSSMHETEKNVGRKKLLARSRLKKLNKPKVIERG